MTRPYLIDWRLLTGALAVSVVFLAVWALGVGAAKIPLADVWTILAQPQLDNREALVIWDVRLPRVLSAVLVGSALSVAGAIMQALTGNPLAEPGILGVNAGAAFAVVALLVIVGPGLGGTAQIWGAFAGATMATIAVYVLGAMGRAGASPVKLVLAGVVVSTLLGVLTASVLILDSQTLDAVRLWTAGSLRGRELNQVLSVAPYVCIGLVLSLLLREQFTVLSLGSDVAHSMGQNPVKWRSIAAVLVVVLAGGAVALAGPIGFVGLVVPHMARLTVGADYRRVFPVALVAGGFLTLLADSLPRALWGNDVPVGISLALIGAPFFIYLARNRLRAAA